MKIVIPTELSIGNESKSKLKTLVDEFYDDMPSRPEFKKRINRAEIITSSYYIPVDRDLIDAAPNLRYIIVPAVGYQTIDIEYAASRDIKVLNCPTHNSQAVAEYAITLLLAANRSIVAAQTEIRQGKWNDDGFVGFQVNGRKLFLVGHGNVGRRIETLAQGLGMSVEFADSKTSGTDFDRLLAAADFICLCTPLNNQTRHLLDRRRLELLKASAILVNVGRGAVVEQDALLDVLAANKIRAAALDVFENEPNIGETPNEQIMALASLPNIIATPHMAYNTAESRQNLGEEIIANIKACINGQPVNVVN